MMRGQRHMAVAVRHPKGHIVVHSEPLNGAIYTSSWAKLPFLRGLTLLWDTLVLGVRTLIYSANVALEEEETEITPKTMWGMLGTALFFVVALFFVAPMLLIGWLDQAIPSSFVSNLVEGVVRIGILVAYIGGISFLPDIRRGFAYHGAEHKVVSALEAGEELDVQRVQTYGTAHPRCGTAFLLIIMVISVLIFALLGRPPMWLRTISRIVLIPVIATVGYEFVRFGANHIKNRLVYTLLRPGLALQKLTTREPDDSMVEVAITALKRVIEADAGVEPASQVKPATSTATSAAG